MKMEDATLIGRALTAAEARMNAIEAKVISTELLLHAVIQSAPDLDAILRKADEILSSDVSAKSKGVAQQARERLQQIVSAYRSGTPETPLS